MYVCTCEYACMHACGYVYRYSFYCLYMYVYINVHMSTRIIKLMDVLIIYLNQHICTWLCD